MGLGEIATRVAGAQPPEGQPPSGGSLTAHVATAAALGGGMASIVEWLIEVGFRVVPPEAVDSGISAICIFVASLLMRKMVD